MLPYRNDLKQTARHLRQNMTDAERLLWHRLRSKQIGEVRFYRQKPIGPYVVDFYAPKVNLVIEIDGGQHSRDEYVSLDVLRDRYMKSRGLYVLRFNNLDILKNRNGVLQMILQHIEKTKGV